MALSQTRTVLNVRRASTALVGPTTSKRVARGSIQQEAQASAQSVSLASTQRRLALQHAPGRRVMPAHTPPQGPPRRQLPSALIVTLASTQR